ncbi:MAG: sigma 54-interacting transcriptional regulator [Bacteriovoracaceae bacterium]|nr:sigma 54-interacting transcriptional regulator [Bacteriovoracaceae bacterium]
MMDSVTKNLTKIQEISSILLSSLDESVFFPTLGKLLHDHVGVDKTLVYMVQENGSVRLVSKNGKLLKKGKTLDKGTGPSGHVIRTKKPYFSNNTDRDPLFQAAKEEGIRAELAIPVSHEGIVIGTIHFQCIESEKEFTRDDITAVLEILNELRHPLANMRMYLAAKHLNESLLRQIEVKEKEIQKRDSGVNLGDSFRIEEREIVGKSDAMKLLVHLADKVAQADVNALLIGERGVGKEMVGRRIHCRSTRGEHAFISIDCSALDELALEREIFGEEGGNFKEMKVRNGLLELANGGTLFLNNVDRLTLHLQSKLHNFLNEKMAFRVGGHMPYRANVRLIVASTKDLNELVLEGAFREDLLFAVNTMILKVPSLKERQDDIETLATHFLNAHKKTEEQKSLSPGVVKLLREYNWPGNVRELQNVIERAYILSDGMIVERDHLADSVTECQIIEEKEEENAIHYSEMTLDELEKRHICMTLEHLGGNKTKTAKMLGITVKTLYNKLHSYGMIGNQDA